MKCRHCAAPLALPLVDLGTSPPSNAYLDASRLDAPEAWYPLRVLVCESCWLAQTQDFTQADALFDAEYAYFSSYSSSWLAHAQDCVTQMRERFALGPDSFVVEIASNDGYLLQYISAAGIPCLGIEPTASTAAAARERGIETLETFFGARVATALAAEGRSADLMVANNVLAHVPDINDFVRGFAHLLKPGGVATFEFPHLQRLIEECQFDTIYHEHFSYLSLTAVQRIVESQGLSVFDVAALPTHGGSLRVFVQQQGGPHPTTEAVTRTLHQEHQAGLCQASTYHAFQARTESIKNQFLRFLLDCKDRGESVAGYGAAAKGNTLLNLAGVRADLISYVVDLNPAKQGKFLPGSRIPIVAPEPLHASPPDWVVIFPWNLRREIIDQLASLRAQGTRFVTAIPELKECT